MLVLIDNGHGKETPGKCSPDGHLREWWMTRELSSMLSDALSQEGIDSRRIVPEEEDISLRERVRRVNEICARERCLVVSLHLNAAGNGGKWMSARGFSSHVSMNAGVESRLLAKMLWDAAVDEGLSGNRSIPREGYISQNLAICRDTRCPAVLTENLFQDNRQDMLFLLSAKGKAAIVRAHVRGIQRFLEEQEQKREGGDYEK